MGIMNGSESKDRQVENIISEWNMMWKAFDIKKDVLENQKRVQYSKGELDVDWNLYYYNLEQRYTKGDSAEYQVPPLH